MFYALLCPLTLIYVKYVYFAPYSSIVSVKSLVAWVFGSFNVILLWLVPGLFMWPAFTNVSSDFDMDSYELTIRKILINLALCAVAIVSTFIVIGMAELLTGGGLPKMSKGSCDILVRLVANMYQLVFVHGITTVWLPIWIKKDLFVIAKEDI
jgi:hypothetical protein